MSLINMSATSGGLRKTGGCDGCPDASAVSQQQISGTGTLTFAASETASLRFVGLAAGGVGTGPGDINFALRLQSGVAEVRESGTYKSDVRFAAGDTFAISIASGVVKYSKNGSVFYTSTVRADRAVRAHAVFFSANAAVANVGFSGSSTTAQAGPAAVGSTMSGVRYAIRRPEGSVPRRRR
jgi:hypothetical protein